MSKVDDGANTLDIHLIQTTHRVNLMWVYYQSNNDIELDSKGNQIHNQLALFVVFVIITALKIDSSQIVKNYELCSVLSNRVFHCFEKCGHRIWSTVFIYEKFATIMVFNLLFGSRSHLVVCGILKMSFLNISLACQKRIKPVLCLEVWQLAREEKHILVLFERLTDDLIDKGRFTSTVNASNDIQRSIEQLHKVSVQWLDSGCYTVNLIQIHILNVGEINNTRNRTILSVEDDFKYFFFAEVVQHFIKIIYSNFLVVWRNCILWDFHNLCPPTSKSVDNLFLHFDTCFVVVRADNDIVKLFKPIPVLFNPMVITTAQRNGYRIRISGLNSR